VGKVKATAAVATKGAAAVVATAEDNCSAEAIASGIAT